MKKLRHSEVFFSGEKPISSLIAKEVIPVRFVEGKPSQQGKVPRTMQNIGSRDGKFIRINLAAFVACAAHETRDIIHRVIAEVPPDPGQPPEEHKQVKDFLRGKAKKIEFFTLLGVYHGLQKFEFKDGPVGPVTLMVPMQDMGPEVQRYARMAGQLKENGYY